MEEGRQQNAGYLNASAAAERLQRNVNREHFLCTDFLLAFWQVRFFPARLLAGALLQQRCASVTLPVQAPIFFAPRSPGGRAQSWMWAFLHLLLINSYTGSHAQAASSRAALAA